MLETVAIHLMEIFSVRFECIMFLSSKLNVSVPNMAILNHSFLVLCYSSTDVGHKFVSFSARIESLKHCIARVREMASKLCFDSLLSST